MCPYPFKILVHNETNDENEQHSDTERDMDYQKITDEFNTFVELFKTTWLIDYSKVEYINKF